MPPFSRRPPVFKRAASSNARCFALALLASSLAVTTAARAGVMDDFNPMNWFGADKYKQKIINDPPADTLYKRGVTEMNTRDFERSAKTFNRLEKAYPYSAYQRKGLIMAAYAQYQHKKFDDAIGTTKRYIALFPNSPDTAYMVYLEGMSYYDQIADVNHDLGNAEKAIEVFNSVVTKYPGSEYANDARYKISVAKDQLAGQEMQVGRYYLEGGNYTAAINRFRTVLAKYQTTRQSEEALERLTEAYLAMGLPNEAQTAAAVLGHNYPDSPWYKEAYTHLRSQGGLAPSEDKGSWISKAYGGVTRAAKL